MMEDYFNNRYRVVYNRDIVVLSDVMRDKNKRKYIRQFDVIFMNDLESRCFGFIEFNAEVDTQMLVDHLPHVIDGKTVECKLAVPKNNKDSDKKKKRKKSDMMQPSMLKNYPLVHELNTLRSPLTAPESPTLAYRHKIMEDCYQSL